MKDTQEWRTELSMLSYVNGRLRGNVISGVTILKTGAVQL
jgi:hypothetical protein